MTISSLVNKNQYIADGSITSFTYSFRILDASDIRVVLTNPFGGADSVKTLNVDYTVSGVGDAAGGSVTFLIPPLSLMRVTVMRSTKALQPEHYVENDPFPAEAHETALDRAATVAQTTAEEISRSVRVGYGTSEDFRTLLPPITLEAAGKSLVVRKDLTGIDFGVDSFVVGPDSSTDNAVPRWDGTGGRHLQDSLVTIDDMGKLTAPSIVTGEIDANKVKVTNLEALVATIDDLNVPDTINAGAILATDIHVTRNLNANEVNAVDLNVSGTFHANDYGAINTTDIVASSSINSPQANLDHIVTKDIKVVPNASTPGTIEFYDSTGTKYVGFRSPQTVSSTVLYNLPPVDGIPGQVLTTDGMGNLTWETGVPQQPFLGTLATLADVRFTNLRAGNIFATPNGRVWSNPDAGTFMNFQPPSPYISFTNVNEIRAANINMNRYQIKGALLVEKTEDVQTVAATPTTTLNVALANTFILNQGVDVTLNFTAPPSSGQHYSFTLFRNKDASGDARVIIWPSSVKWSGGVAPTLTQNSSAVDVFIFRTIDGGISWLGYAASISAGTNTGPVPKPFTGTLASLSDVNLQNPSVGQIFASSDGTTYVNSSPGQPLNSKISLTNVAEQRAANINMNRVQIKNALLKKKLEDSVILNSTPTTTIDISTANAFTFNQSLNVTLIFNSPASSNQHYSFMLIRVKDNTATARSITWPSNVIWSGAVAPTLTQTAGGQDIFIFRTVDGGNTWMGYPASLNLG